MITGDASLVTEVPIERYAEERRKSRQKENHGRDGMGLTINTDFSGNGTETTQIGVRLEICDSPFLSVLLPCSVLLLLLHAVSFS